MKGILIGTLMMLATAAAHADAPAEITVSGVLKTSATDQSLHTGGQDNYSGYEIVVTNYNGETTVYDILLAGNTCGRAIELGQIEDAGAGAIVEMLADVQLGSRRVDYNGTLHEEIYMGTYDDGSHLIVESKPQAH